MYKTINNKLFKKYDDSYYVSRDGDVYSVKRSKLMKWDIDKNGYLRLHIHGKPMKIHRLVYLTWVTRDLKNQQINHVDDNKMNPSVSNLYLGNQKQNIQDCIRNGHRIGNMSQIIVYDRVNDKTIICAPAKRLIEYCGKRLPNGSIKALLKRKWFQKQYEILEFKQVESVTTKPDECKVVDGRLIPIEAHRQ